MIQETVDRIAPMIPPDRILVVTNDSYISLLKSSCPIYPLKTLLVNLLPVIPLPVLPLLQPF